jgi:hypothetical protein
MPEINVRSQLVISGLTAFANKIALETRIGDNAPTEISIDPERFQG